MKSLLFLCCFALYPWAAQTAPQKPVAKIRHTILVNKWDNTLRFYQTGQPTRRFSVATGLYRCTPEGTFRIVEKSFISRDGQSPFGTRWMGLNTLGKRGLYHVGIHGTNEPQSIGKYASKACVRMNNRDVNWLYERVPCGTTVRIVDVAQTVALPTAEPPRFENASYFSANYFEFNRFSWQRAYCIVP